jgi:hypothetical protein
MIHLFRDGQSPALLAFLWVAYPGQVQVRIESGWNIGNMAFDALGF